MASLKNQAFLLVDGYNIIGAWPILKKSRDHYGLEAARHKLVECLINYSAHNGLKTEVVFDAHYQRTPAYQETYTDNVSVYYTDFGQTADTYIEKLCASFYRQQVSAPMRLIVATSDNAHRLTVMGYGAEWLSAQRLEAEVDFSSVRLRNRQKAPIKSQSRFLYNSIDPKAREVLSQWRHGIY